MCDKFIYNKVCIAWTRNIFTEKGHMDQNSVFVIYYVPGTRFRKKGGKDCFFRWHAIGF